ncbi:MAG: polysaccharide biosynthesis protein [Ruminococcaceae bacterium]|nr:polysaccharide biosynthesis protein [Oscillospiraceae bacterium]
MNKRVFYKNTAVMTGCSLVLRLMGIVFRIFISNRVGAEGMGLYQLVFSVYVLGTTFATSGIITAVTRLAAEHLAKGNPGAVIRLMRLCAFCCLLVGGVSALLLFGGAPYIGRLLGDSRAVPAIAYSGIALPFIGISSCLKGYFLAKRQAWPPCLAQMLEQAVRIGSILWMLNEFWDGSLAGACLIIVLGDALSETVACIYLLCAYRHQRRYTLPQDRQPGAPLLRPMLHIALPLTAGRYLSTALRTVENFLVPARLTRYTRSETASLAQFGAVKGMALPLIFFPSALLMTVSGLLIPELSDAYALGHRRQVTRLVELSLQITLLGAILVGGLFTVLGKPLGVLLYNDPLAGTLLQVLGPLTPVMYLDSVVTGMLKGLGQQVHSLWFSVTDSVVRILLIVVLLPHYGLAGFLFVMVVSNLLTGSLSTARLLTVSGAGMQWSRWILRPLLAAGIAGGICLLLPFEGTAYLILSALLFTGVYVGLMPLLGCFNKEDWKQLISQKGQQKAAVD